MPHPPSAGEVARGTAVPPRPPQAVASPMRGNATHRMPPQTNVQGGGVPHPPQTAQFGGDPHVYRGCMQAPQEHAPRPGPAPNIGNAAQNSIPRSSQGINTPHDEPHMQAMQPPHFEHNAPIQPYMEAPRQPQPMQVQQPRPQPMPVQQARPQPAPQQPSFRPEPPHQQMPQPQQAEQPRGGGGNNEHHHD
ncbi:peptidase C14 caspase catalytic subunit p20 [Candidatus Burkholderia pumila]|uniref:Peptidase C14 caspase catalytic subunit p20 n=1 Tax=Candidatus Burkholderia pumila TaxID=1090375 RepID=A0ABR5HLT0_9BURK|nr:peptidase C14 caspase catalytic subunit p20 [Candidatus Burkholderia pumila]